MNEIIGYGDDLGYFYCVDCKCEFENLIIPGEGHVVYGDNSAFDNETCDLCGKAAKQEKKS